MSDRELREAQRRWVSYPLRANLEALEAAQLRSGLPSQKQALGRLAQAVLLGAFRLPAVALALWHIPQAEIHAFLVSVTTRLEQRLPSAFRPAKSPAPYTIAIESILKPRTLEDTPDSSLLTVCMAGSSLTQLHFYAAMSDQVLDITHEEDMAAIALGGICMYVCQHVGVYPDPPNQPWTHERIAAEICAPAWASAEDEHAVQVSDLVALLSGQGIPPRRYG